jgi:hypothetical protein
MTTTHRYAGRSFTVRESQSQPGCYNLYLQLNGRGRGYETWVALAESNTPAAFNAAIAAAKQRGEF